MSIMRSFALPVVGATLIGGSLALAFPEQAVPVIAAQGAVAPAPIELDLVPDPSPLAAQVAARKLVAREQAVAARAAAQAAEAAAATAAKEAADREAADRARQERASRSRSGDPKSIAREQLAARGQGDQFSCLDKLWTKESGWRVNATNPSSGAYGIPQSLPANKMASAGADWRTNAATQIRWGLGYIDARYGSPCAAWSHSQTRNWY